MSDVIIPQRFLIRGGTAADLAAVNETPKSRELILETDTGRLKRGDGATAYNDLPYINTGKIDFSGIADGKVPMWSASNSRFEIKSITADGVEYTAGSSSSLAADNVAEALDELSTKVDEKIGDAPSDGNTYGRKDGAWALASGGGGGNTFASINIEPDGTTSYGFSLKGRQVSGLAVAYITPETNNTPCVWDVFPKGAPDNFTTSTGVAWLDLCSTDIEADGTNYECLRMGIFSGGDAHIGHQKGGTGTVRNLRLQINGGNVGIGLGSPPYLLTISAATLPVLCVQDTGVDKFFFGQATAAGNWFTGSADGDHCIRGMGGKVHIGSNASTPIPAITIHPGSAGRVDVNGDSLRIATAKTPASAGAAGTQGQVAWDANYIYICVAPNTWKRAALSTW